MGALAARSASAARPLCPPLGGASPDGADSATRGGSFVPPRTPFLSPSAATEPVSSFRRSGWERQVGPPSLRSAVPSRSRREDPETTVPPPGNVGAMNGAGEAPLFPAEALPGGLLGLRCVPKARWRGRAGAGTPGDGGDGAFWMGWRGPEGGSFVGEDAGEGLRCSMVTAGCSYQVRAGV